MCINTSSSFLEAFKVEEAKISAVSQAPDGN